MEHTNRCYEIKPGFFTEKEEKVWCLFIEGLSRKQIAVKLCNSARTINNYIEAIYLKLDAHNQAEAVHKSYIKGIVKITTTTLSLMILMNALAGFTGTERRAIRNSPRFSYRTNSARTRNVSREVNVQKG